MPLDDAIGLIGRSFEKYVEDLRSKANAAATASTSAASTSGISRVFLPPSSEVTYLLNLLADNRALTVAELDTVIGYLQERRDKLVDADKRPMITDEKELRKFAKEKSNEPSGKKAAAATATKESKETSQKQTTHEELTKKILSIFQGVDPSTLTQVSASMGQVPVPQPAPAPAPPPAPASGSGSGSGANLINFDNPNVQKALDNLIQTGPNLLKNFSSASKSPVSSASVTSMSQINLAPPVGDEAGGMGDMAAMAAMGMGMYGGQHGMMMPQGGPMGAFNLPGGMGPMGGMPEFSGNYPSMPHGGPPPPPPPNQRY